MDAVRLCADARAAFEVNPYDAAILDLGLPDGDGLKLLREMRTKGSEMWMLGIVILLLMMATAFLGYVLPWSQMAFWGATVITNLFSAVPLLLGMFERPLPLPSGIAADAPPKRLLA